MAGITLAEAQAMLDAYREAEIKALAGQSYSLLGRTLTRANLKDIRDGIMTWDRMVKDLDAKARGRSRAVNVSPNW